MAALETLPALLHPAVSFSQDLEYRDREDLPLGAEERALWTARAQDAIDAAETDFAWLLEYHGWDEARWGRFAHHIGRFFDQ